MTEPRDADPLDDTVPWTAAPMPAAPPPPPPPPPGAAPAGQAPLPDWAPPPPPGADVRPVAAPVPQVPTASGWAAPGAPGWAAAPTSGRGSRRGMLLVAVVALGVVGALVAWSVFDRAAEPGAAVRSPGVERPLGSPGPAATDAATDAAATTRPGATPDASDDRPAGSPGAPSPGTLMGTDADQATLLGLVPDEIRGTCERVELLGEQVAALSCATPDGRALYYEDYAERAALDRDWASVLADNGLTEDRGDCTAGEPGERGWYYEDGDPDSSDGRDACFLDEDTPVFLWTDYATTTRMWLFGEDGAGLASVYQRWNEGDLDPVR